MNYDALAELEENKIEYNGDVICPNCGSDIYATRWSCECPVCGMEVDVACDCSVF